MQDMKTELRRAFVAGCCAALDMCKSGMSADDLDEAGCDYAQTTMAGKTEFSIFHNRLRKLLNIDQHELIEAGVMTADDTEQWQSFQRDPWRWFIRADDHRAGLVWKIMGEGKS